MPFVTATAADYNLEVLKGDVTGSTMISIFGHAPILGTTSVVIGGFSADTHTIDQSALDSTPATVSIASSSTNDASGGSGLRTFLLSGLDSSSDAQSETITMNGQTTVTSSNTYSAINGMRGLTWGVTTWNEGTVNVGSGSNTSGVLATKHCVMAFDPNTSMGHSKGLCAYYAIPNGKTLYLRQITSTVGTSNKDVQLNIQSSTNASDWVSEGIFELESGASLIGPITAVPGIAGGTHVRISGKSSGASTNVTAVIAAELVDD